MANIIQQQRPPDGYDEFYGYALALKAKLSKLGLMKFSSVSMYQKRSSYFSVMLNHFVVHDPNIAQTVPVFVFLVKSLKYNNIILLQRKDKQKC